MNPNTLKLSFRGEYQYIEAVVFRGESDLHIIKEFAGGYFSDIYDSNIGITCAYVAENGQEFQLYPGCALYRIPGTEKINIAPITVLSDLFTDMKMSLFNFDSPFRT